MLAAKLGWAHLSEEREAEEGATSADGHAQPGQEEEPAPAARLVNRLALCILALALLWLSSLKVAQLLTDAAVPPPALADVIGACGALRDGARTEREAHSRCAAIQADRCARDLDAAIAAAAAARDAARAANAAAMELALARAERCTRAREAARAALRRLAARSTDPVRSLLRTPGSGACVAAAHAAAADEVVGSAGGDGALAAADAERVTLLDALRSRAEYDGTYLAQKAALLAAAPSEVRAAVAQQLEQLQRSLRAQLPTDVLACVVLSTDGADGPEYAGPSCPLGSSAQATVESALAQLANGYEGALAQADATRMRAVALAAEAQGDLARAEAVLARLRALEHALAAVGLSVGAIPPPAWPLPPLPELELPPLPASVRAGSLALLLPPSAIVALRDVRARLDALPAAAAAGAEGALEQAAGGLLDRLPGLLTDYDPPPLPPLEAAEARAARASADAVVALGRVRVALAEADGTFRGGAGAGGAGTERALGAKGTFNGGAQLPAPPDGEPLEWPQLATAGQWLLARAAGVGTLTAHVDVLARVLASARVVARFAAGGGGGVDAPLDVRPATSAALGALGGRCGALLRSSPAVLLVRAVASPWAWALLAGTLAVALASTLGGAWATAYTQFEAACAPPGADGGVLSRNAFAAAFDWAAEAGDRTLSLRLAEHERARARACAEWRAVETSALAGGAQSAAESRREAEVLARRAADAAHALAAVRVCRPAGAPAGGGEEEALADALGPAQCPVDVPAAPAELASLALECDALPACAHTCSGPSRPLLRALARWCGCTAEMGAHAHALRWLLALATYAALNASRLLLVGGLGRFCWRELFAGEFEFLATCDAAGQPADGTVAALRAEAERAGGALRAGGRMRCAAAGGLLLPWLLLVVRAARHVSVMPGRL
ncbi:hypothetical protein T492DRAFT_1122751 [Pavlovales sp. CCMP2436]|nr:hypothetical protein T492DRAFT_1122751 [Pavlovales sp. CCMP2436]